MARKGLGRLTVFGGMLEDVGVDAMGVGVEDLRSGVLGAECFDLLTQQLVVSAGDLVEVAQAAMAIVFRVLPAVEGEHGGHASQRRQVHHHDRVGDGHDH